MTQDSLSCQKILLQTITCIASAAVRRQMSCSLLIPLSRHLSHRSATSQSVRLARLAFGPNPYAVHGLTLQTEPQAYPRTAKGKHYPKYCWKGCLQGVFEWDMRETNSWYICVASPVWHGFCVMEADTSIGYHQSFRQSFMRPSTNLRVENHLIAGQVRSEQKNKNITITVF